MGDASLADQAPAAALRSRRAQVLDCLRDLGEPATVAAVADRTGLHVNTARFHLDGLVRQGQAERRAEQRGSPGRPRILYTARAETAGPRSYQLLARMLAGIVASLEEDAAAEAGRSWGRQLVEPPAPAQQVDVDTALHRLHALLDKVGFEPETDRAGEVEVRIHHCPFREVAEEHADVVCAMHLGLMQGALDELGAPVEVEGLQPFVTPQLCVARLRLTRDR